MGNNINYISANYKYIIKYPRHLFSTRILILVGLIILSFSLEFGSCGILTPRHGTTTTTTRPPTRRTVHHGWSPEVIAPTTTTTRHRGSSLPNSNSAGDAGSRIASTAATRRFGFIPRPSLWGSRNRNATTTTPVEPLRLVGAAIISSSSDNRRSDRNFLEKTNFSPLLPQAPVYKDEDSANNGNINTINSEKRFRKEGSKSSSEFDFEPLLGCYEYSLNPNTMEIQLEKRK